MTSGKLITSDICLDTESNGPFVMAKSEDGQDIKDYFSLAMQYKNEFETFDLTTISSSMSVSFSLLRSDDSQAASVDLVLAPLSSPLYTSSCSFPIPFNVSSIVVLLK